MTYSHSDKKWQLLIKRMMDIVISLATLTILLPLLILIALLVKLTSQGPIFYRWRLLGVDKKHFTSYKFRTMIENAEEIEKELRNNNMNEMNGVYFKLKNDFRVTPIGKILRKFSLDELPQLYSILIGDMSLVGPRPVRISEKDGLDSCHDKRFIVKPGATSSWVVSGKNKINDFTEIIKLDIDYINNWSLWLDIKIILKTVPIILLGRNN